MRCWISIGSNQDRVRSVRAAVAALREQFGPLVLSSVYETAAVGFDGEPFFNLVAGIDTGLSVREIVGRLRSIEDANGRVRGGERFAPRTLDLDLLTYGDTAGEIDGVELPRAEILRHTFVLGPLAEVAPVERHPTLGLTYAQLWAGHGDAQALRRVDVSLPVD
jgi:2-amino-4-hydroxy-6-hydroxymethyldihydropteridine diphosphokinase